GFISRELATAGFVNLGWAEAFEHAWQLGVWVPDATAFSDQLAATRVSGIVEGNGKGTPLDAESRFDGHVHLRDTRVFGSKTRGEVSIKTRGPDADATVDVGAGHISAENYSIEDASVKAKLHIKDGVAAATASV